MPHAAVAHDLVGRPLDEVGIDAPVVLREIVTADEAVAWRFLGSPTIRVEGVDVEPGTDARSDFMLTCRVFRTTTGSAGVPDEALVARALAGSAQS